MTESKKPSFAGLVVSACAAAFGVQSRKNLDRDFTQSSVLPFIVAGIIFTVVFIGAVVLVVKLVLTDL